MHLHDLVNNNSNAYYLNLLCSLLSLSKLLYYSRLYYSRRNKLAYNSYKLITT